MRLVAAAVLAIPSVAFAQGLRAVQPLPGYQCMALATPDSIVPVLQSPSASAPRVGIAGATVIVASPVQNFNGYFKVLHLSGQPGWINAAQLRPWRVASDPQAKCTPSLMSDGRPGFR